MALHTLVANADELLIQLGVWALRASVVALCAGFALAVLRVRSTSARLLAWTAVLYAALAIPVLGLLLPGLPFSLPVDLQPVAAPPAPVTEQPRTQSPSRRIYTGQSSADIPAVVATGEKASAVNLPAIPWATIIIMFYLGVGTVLSVRLVLGSVLSQRLLRVATEIQDPALTRRLRYSNSRGRLLPRIYESELVAVPVTIGVIRPVIVLPESWREWDEPKLDTIFTHELSHVDRRDALTQFVALLHRAIFWFSPLSWWLARHLANLAEQASDEAALARGADRNQYAKTLLGFFEALETAPRRVWWQGVSMAHAGRAEERVQKILAWKGVFKMGLKKPAVVLILGLAIPLVYVAALAGPAKPAQAPVSLEQAAPSAAPSPAESPAPPAPKTAPSGGVTAPPIPAAPENGVSTSGPASIAPVAPFGPAAAIAPAAPVAPVAGEQNQSFSTRRLESGDDFDDEQRFVIVSGNSDSFTMSGSSEDVRHVKRLRKQIPGDFIWFERDEKSYIVRDQPTVDRARKLWAPQEELGKKQEALGKLQEALGKQQEALGQRMEQVRVSVPDMTAELDRLKAKMQKLGPSASMEQLGELQSEIGELQSKIGTLQSEAGAQQSTLGAQQGELGEKQGELGRQQGELGRQQGELARKAAAEMKQLLDDAIQNGTAKPEPQESGSATL